MIVDRKTVVVHDFKEQVEGKKGYSDNIHAPLTIN